MLGPFKDTIQGVISFTWPMVLISAVILASFRICYLVKNHEKIIIYKELSMLIFGIYILCLFQIVTFQDDVSWSTNNFIPFKEILRYDISSRLFIKNVLGNMLLFLPFGFFTSLYLKVEKMHLPIILTLIASILIEIVQMCIGRVFDVDDIILNLIGGILGFAVYNLLKKIGNKLPDFCKKEWFLDTISIMILIFLIVGIIIIL